MKHLLAAIFILSSCLEFSCKRSSVKAVPDSVSSSPESLPTTESPTTESPTTESLPSPLKDAVLTQASEIKDAFSDYKKETEGDSPQTKEETLLSEASENIENHSASEIAEYLVSNDYKEVKENASKERNPKD